MALRRNIAGIPDNRNMGLTSLKLNYGLPTTQNTFTDPIAWQQAPIDYEAEMNAHYNWLMSHSYEEITAAGYYVTTDNGSIFQWIDKAAGNSTVYLSLDWIQKIENTRGTPGALLLHMQEPALAKDTAGYEGGTSGTWYQGTGVTDPTTQQVVAPINEVASLPPVIVTDGGVQFEAPSYTPPGAPTITTTTTTTSVPLPIDRETALKNNFLPLAVIAGVLGVVIVGDALPRQRLIALGGVGALFYLMAKKQ
jgi:hypothetical protein